MKAPTRKELSARGFAVRRLLEKSWPVWGVECRTAIQQLRTVAEAPRFVTFRAAALYALTLRGSRGQRDRLEDVVNQLDAHAKGQFALEEGYRKQLDAELLELLAALPDPFEPPQPPRYEVLTSIAETVVVAFSFPKDDIREQVKARRAARSSQVN